MLNPNRCSLVALLVLAACSSPPGDESDDDPARDRSPGGAAAKFFLPTGAPDNTSAPSIEIDAQGGIHAVYAAFAGGGAYYAYCPADCGGVDDVRVVRLETTGSVANAMIALDRDGRPHVLLSAAQGVYYASSAGDFAQQASWTTSLILAHNGDREVTGEAFALDPEGRPRFLMHTYVAYLGVGQKPMEALYVTCDGACDEPASWAQHKLADHIWKYSQLRIDAAGRIRVATIATLEGGDNGAAYGDYGAYIECNADCADGANWIGQVIAPAFSNELDAVPVKPAIALALTSAGAPRVVLLGKDEALQRNIGFYACDGGCTASAWAGTILSEGNAIGAGLDLALDAQDHPRFTYTQDYGIGLAECNDARCESAEAKWTLSKVEAGSDMSPDEIFLWDNCYVGAWFLHSPSIALSPGGAPRIGYQARDISGGFENPDDDKPDCEAGTDMSWSRLSIL